MTDRLLTVSEAARLLRVHPATLRAWADRGQVPVVWLPSGFRRFDREEMARVARETGMDQAAGRDPGADGSSTRAERTSPPVRREGRMPSVYQDGQP